MAVRNFAKHPVAAGIGLFFGLMTGVGILLAAATKEDVLAAVLIIGGFLGACVAGVVGARFRKPGEPL